MGSQERQTLAPAAVDAIRSGDIDTLKQALETDRDLVRTGSTDNARSSTSPRTGPATFRITPPA
jgi:hypothetical protein